MAYNIRFNEEKNELLKATRGVSFEDVQNAVESDNLLADIIHPSQKHPRQRLYVIKVRGYVYAVPYIINEEKQEIFLKTIYPSRTLMKLYKKGGENEKTKKQ